MLVRFRPFHFQLLRQFLLLLLQLLPARADAAATAALPAAAPWLLPRVDGVQNNGKDVTI